MGKWDDWLRNVAGMERPELIESFETEAKLREKAQNEVEAVRAAAERDKKTLVSKLKSAHHAEPLIFVGFNSQACNFALRRMGINPNRAKFVYTDSLTHEFRGWIVRPEQVRLVRGWSDGRHAAEVQMQLAMSLSKFEGGRTGWEALAYAPDPQDERLL